MQCIEKRSLSRPEEGKPGKEKHPIHELRERETPSSSSLSLYTSITHNIILHTLNPLQEFVYQEETTESVRKVTSHPVS